MLNHHSHDDRAATGTTATKYRRSAPCDLCGEHDVLSVGEQDRRGRPLATVMCMRCGLVSHAQIPTVPEVHEYYASQYRADYHGQAAPSAHRVIRAWNTGKELFRRMAPFMRAGDEVFEIGAGLGCNLKAFELAGYRASGIEPTGDFQAFANRLHVAVRQDTLEGLTISPAYDVVILSHVIEHLRSPKTALTKIRGLLRPGGRLYLECPNAGAPHAAPGKMFHFAHIYNFMHSTLLATAQAAGFTLLKQYSSADSGNLMLVLEASRTFTNHLPLPVEIPRDAFAQAHRRLTRFSRLSYYLRPSYLAQRLFRLASLHSDRLFAQQRLQTIFRECEAHAAAQAARSVSRRKAA